MPLLFNFGQHSVLDTVISRLVALLDDLFALCDLGRIAECWRKNCGGTPEYKSTRTRLRFGTRVDLLQLVGKTWKPVHG